MRWERAANGIRKNLHKLYHKDGYFVKGFLMLEPTARCEYDNTLDISSLYGPYMYAQLSLNDKG